ncbi:MAG: hypothetical protein JNK05_11640 [Myxococcales bacterium]|nr:hypothetical protein [Myxococcales bacterium]
MNTNRHWTFGCLNLELYDDTFFFDDYSDPLVPELRDYQPVAVGCTRIDDDDWNAVFIFRFAWWVSTFVPDSLVRVIDDGGRYAEVGVCAVDGAWHLDKKALKAVEQFVIDTGRWCQDYHRFQRVRAQALKGYFFADISSERYAERPEIEALGLSGEELEWLTIDDVADRIRFPWDEDNA